MTTALAVRRLAAADIPAAVAIIQGLPDYFTHDVPAQIDRDAKRHGGWVVTTPEVVVGVAPPVGPPLPDGQHRLDEGAVLRAEGEAEPGLKPRYLFVREATIERHSAEAKPLDRLSHEVLHAVIMPQEPHSHATAGPARPCRACAVVSMIGCRSVLRELVAA